MGDSPIADHDSLAVTAINNLLNLITIGGIERGTVEPVQSWFADDLGDDR